MKKLIVLAAAMMMVVSVSGLALAKDVKGKVTAVNGDVITVEVEKGKAADIAVGADVEVEVKGDKAPKKGGDMLQGC